jgi:rare lipoprotein A
MDKMKNIILSFIILFLFTGLARAELGIASWYSTESSGNITANGERYNEDALTCASMDYDFNTLLRVINIENGKSIIVRVNDRGNFKKKYGRIIDLTPKAFSAIGNLKQGLLKVKIEKL